MENPGWTAGNKQPKLSLATAVQGLPDWVAFRANATGATDLVQPVHDDERDARHDEKQGHGGGVHHRHEDDGKPTRGPGHERVVRRPAGQVPPGSVTQSNSGRTRGGSRRRGAEQTRIHHDDSTHRYAESSCSWQTDKMSAFLRPHRRRGMEHSSGATYGDTICSTMVVMTCGATWTYQSKSIPNTSSCTHSSHRWWDIAGVRRREGTGRFAVHAGARRLAKRPGDRPITAADLSQRNGVRSPRRPPELDG